MELGPLVSSVIRPFQAEKEEAIKRSVTLGRLGCLWCMTTTPIHPDTVPEMVP